MRRRIFRVGAGLAAVALTLALASCGGAKRDISTPEKALLGHWKSAQRGARVNYYIGDQTFILQAPGGSMELSYNVVYSDDRANKVVIEVVMDVPALSVTIPIGLEKELTFSKNRKSMTEVTEANGVALTYKWKYVDAKQRP